MKYPRLALAALLPLCASSTSLIAAADSVVVINEIHYHPADEINDTEWIELRSLMGVNVDMSGWEMEGGINYTFAEGTVIPGHGFLLVAANPNHASLAGKNALGPFTGQLSNSGESFRLVNNNDRTMDEVSYGDDNDWPVGADGSGATLSKLDQNTGDSRPANWVASPEVGGSPGSANFPLAGLPPVVTPILTLPSNWSYRDTNTAPPAGWNTPAFDDSAWSVGDGVFYAGAATPTGAGEGLTGYWPLDETSGTSAPNVASGGTNATLFSGATWLNDGARGQVLSFDGVDAYASAGSIPQMTTSNNFTWSFWANTQQGGNTSVMLGNRYSPSGADFSPREFVKFTNNSFEFHRNTAPEDLDYAEIPTNTWVHHAIVKTGSAFTYYRNGVASGSSTISQGTNNPQPLYFGGDKTAENWQGRIDDVAIWEKALPADSIAGIASATYTPLTAPTIEGAGGGNLETELTLGSTAYYFRHDFNYSGSPARTALSLRLLLDDGALIYLNGAEVHRENMPSGAVTHGTFAESTVVDAALSSEILIPVTNLLQGANTIAVEVHQATVGSSDMVFSAILTATEQPPQPGEYDQDIVFSEISGAGDGTFQIELTNSNEDTINLAGYELRSSSGATQALSGTLAAGAQIVVSPTTTPLDGERLFLFRPGGTELADARSVTNRLRGLSGDRWLYPSGPTFGNPNTFAFNEDIVIHEIMYHPRSDTDDQWIELYNRGAAPVNLKNWEFTDGILYTFLADLIVAPGAYAVITSAQWSGSLSGSGERIILRDPSKNIADEVRYADGGRWPEFADGGGSSIELRDPDADNSAPEAWAASVESGDWQTITYSGVATNAASNNPTGYNEFIFGLLDSGTVLIDDISVIENPGGTARQLIQNGNFSGGNTDKWRLLGNHSHAEVVPDPDSPGNMVLRVRATGGTEHMSNHAETTFRNGGTYVTTSSGQTYQISFRAKWLGGSNQLNTRLYFNRLPRTTLLNTPASGGTPGAANSTALANAGPTLSGLIHAPAVPAANNTAVVNVHASDPDGVTSLTLRYSVNGGAYQSTAMTDNGDGYFSGFVPGQSAGAKAQFYIEALDGLGATSIFPPAGAESGTLIPWNDGQANLDYGDCRPNNFRIVLTDANITLMHLATNVMSNDRLPATIIYNESEITYNAGVRLKGSEHGRAKNPRVGWNIGFPADQPFLGCHGTIAVDRSGAGDQFSQKEIMVKHAINHAGGIPGMEDDLIRVIAPLSTHTGSAMLLKSRFDSEWMDNIISNGGDGRMFEYELIYPLSTTAGGGPENLKITQDGGVTGVGVTSLGNDKELFRWNWQIKMNRDEDDYTGIMNFLNVMDLSGSAFRDATDTTLDVDQWLRAFAVQVLFGIGDSYSSGAGHNAAFYIRPNDNKVMYFPWDMDFTFSSGAESSLTPNGDLNQLIAARPAHKRAYYGHIQDIVNTTFNTSYMTVWANHYSCFLPTENLASHLSYITARSNYAIGQVSAAIPGTPYQITTSNGTSTSQSTITLQGDGWVNVRELRLAVTGAVLPITWIDDNSWQVTVPVTPGTNTFVIEAYDHQGNLVDTDTVNITGTGTLVPATAATLAISEVMYNPAEPTTAEQNEGFLDNDDFEYIELQNLSDTLTLDLNGLSFTNGITFDLPATILAPGARLIIAGNQAAFLSRYGNGLPVTGHYQINGSNRLANSGESLTLNDASGAAISSFTFGDKDSWPESADGQGYALILMCPGVNDPADPKSWRTSAALGGNPGASDAIDLAGWMTANSVTDLFSDDDSDGLAALLEYATGSNPALADAKSSVAPSFETDGGQTYLAIEFHEIIGADEIDLSAIHSIDLSAWTADTTYIGRSNNGDGTSTLRFRSNLPFTGNAREFLRIEAAEKP